MNEPENDPAPKENLFSDEAIQNIAGLGDVLRTICARLIREGKIQVIDGKIVEVRQDE